MTAVVVEDPPRVSFRDLAIDLVPCPKCAAAPGEPCHSRAGVAYAGRGYVHARRADPILAAWRVGYAEGGTTVLRAVLIELRRTLPPLVQNADTGGVILVEQLLELLRRTAERILP